MTAFSQLLRKAPLWGLLCFWIASPHAANKPDADAVASAHPLATAAGIAVLQSGGNAFDAAVAVSAVLGVVEPYGSGLGGGGFWLLHEAKTGKQVMVDGREVAPLKAHRDMYLDRRGNPLPAASIDGPLAAGIPGTPKALAHIAKIYGRLPLAVTLAPAIRLADEGFSVDDMYRRYAGFRQQALLKSPAAAQQFLLNGEVPPKGYLLKQPDLANTLKLFAEQGEQAFYQGEFAQRLVAGVQKYGGIWTLEDLAKYDIVERDPITFNFNDYQFTTAALPSSGGVVLAQIFNMLAQFNWDQLDSAQRVHLLTELMRRAYKERAVHLGDTDQVDVPVKQLTSVEYAKQLAKDIDLQMASVSQDLPQIKIKEGMDTSHFSIIDREGNRVAATMSVNYPFGACFVVPGTGVVLNDEMDDFSIKPGVPNAYGLVGNQQNAIAPGKRMLSSMTPTFIENEQRVAILGTPGGSRIISMVMIGALQAMQGAPVEQWVGRARFHHQYLPDSLQYEPDALSEQTLEALSAMGHQLKPVDDSYGNMQAIAWDKVANKVSVASDPRGIGAAVAVKAEQ
jgi:gamma-glutamyltranspeptidase/glutathione hydrolase